MAREKRDYLRRRERQEDELAEMQQEAGRDRQVNRTRNRKRSFSTAFMANMDLRHEIEGYLLGRGKESSKDEPTNFTLSDEEWVTRLIRNQGADSQITAIRAELMELGQAEEDIRGWLLRHHNERWYRGNGEWEDLNYSMQQRLYWIGVEQHGARARVAALEAQVIAMAVFEDAQKMMDQAQAAYEGLSRIFIGPRLGRPAPPPPPYCPYRGRWDGLSNHCGKQVTYEEYMKDYRERYAEDLVLRRRVRDGREEELHQDAMINLGGTIEEYLGEIERHENEVEEIEERRGRHQGLEGGSAAAPPSGAVQGPKVAVKTAKEIVAELKRHAAAVREAFMEDDDDDERDERELDDDTK